MVDSALYEAVLAMMESTVPEFTVAGFVRQRTGSVLPGVAPSNAYPVKDGEILIGANQDTVFRRLAQAMERPELADDPRYATHSARGERQEELDELISAWTQSFDADTLLTLMETHGVPAGKIFKAPDMLKDPHYQARQAVRQVAHPEFENLWMQNVAPRLSATPGEIAWPGPALGAHNADIYGRLLGKSAKDLDRLEKAGII